MTDWLKSLLEPDKIIQGLLAVGLVGAVIYLAVVGLPIPELLGSLAGAAIGFYFGAQVSKK